MKNLHNKQVSLSQEQIVALHQCFDECAKKAKDTVNTSLFFHKLKIDLGIDDESLKKLQLKHQLDQASEVLAKQQAEESKEDK